METVINPISIGGLIAIGGVAFSYVGYIRAKSMDIRNETQVITEMKTKIEAIEKDIDSVKNDNKERHNKLEDKVDKLFTKIDSMNQNLLDFMKLKS